MDNQALDRGIQFWKVAKRYVIAYLFIGTVIGMVLMLNEMSNDDLTSVGPAVSFALLTVFYGLILGYVVFDPIVCLLKARREVTEP